MKISKKNKKKNREIFCIVKKNLRMLFCLMVRSQNTVTLVNRKKNYYIGIYMKTLYIKTQNIDMYT